MINIKIQRKINILLSEIDILDQRIKVLWEKGFKTLNQRSKQLEDINETFDKILVLKAKVSKLYITYSN